MEYTPSVFNGTTRVLAWKHLDKPNSSGLKRVRVTIATFSGGDHEVNAAMFIEMKDKQERANGEYRDQAV